MTQKRESDTWQFLQANSYRCKWQLQNSSWKTSNSQRFVKPCALRHRLLVYSVSANSTLCGAVVGRAVERQCSSYSTRFFGRNGLWLPLTQIFLLGSEVPTPILFFLEALTKNHPPATVAQVSLNHSDTMLDRVGCSTLFCFFWLGNILPRGTEETTPAGAMQFRLNHSGTLLGQSQLLDTAVFIHGAFDFWRYHKIASNGEKFKLFNLKHGLKTQQDFPQPGDWSHWSHQICGNASKYHKIAGHGGNFKLLKPPNISKYVAMIAGHEGKFNLLKPPNMWQRGNAWKYRTSALHKIVSNGGTLNLLKTPNIWQCLKIPTKNVSHGSHTYFASFENTTRLPATGEHVNYWSHQSAATCENTTRLQGTGVNLSYWSHPISPNMWQCLQIP